MIFVLLLLAAAFLAFSNGGNDNCKGVAARSLAAGLAYFIISKLH